ncbi:hypothetical protein N7519_008358 [Penicillium mononematosum]|uniref:uncharacterized protein n=1 Tax=Penicillium mononematosum TaxID=268346 RepID=UPI0025475819|nr:uncharacterized protein N7519_008358 [Penicillium mononematosum]KAJ6177897.1 hypothetical protein N7519_008358 [Penicillium mononematosum]
MTLSALRQSAKRRQLLSRQPTWAPDNADPDPPRVDPASPLNRPCPSLATAVVWKDDGTWLPPPSAFHEPQGICRPTEADIAEATEALLTHHS